MALPSDDHSSRDPVTGVLQRPTRSIFAEANKPDQFNNGTYLALHRVGFAMPSMSPPKRWALTPPFHPYRSRMRCCRRYFFCGTFRGVAPPSR